MAARRAGARLDGAVVEDEDRYDLVGHEVGYRRLGHRAGDVELVSEEWRWQVGGEPLVLTGTVPRADYLAVCDLFEDVAAGVDPSRAQGGPAWRDVRGSVSRTDRS